MLGADISLKRFMALTDIIHKNRYFRHILTKITHEHAHVEHTHKPIKDNK